MLCDDDDDHPAVADVGCLKNSDLDDDDKMMMVMMTTKIAMRIIKESWDDKDDDAGNEAESDEAFH